MSKSDNKVLKRAIQVIVAMTIAIIDVTMVKASTLSLKNYNEYIEEGKIRGIGTFTPYLSFDQEVLKYCKYGHYKLGDDYSPTGNESMPLSNDEDREFAIDSIALDTTYKICGEIDEEMMDYSYYDYEDITSTELNRYEFESKLNALEIGNVQQERVGYGKYNFRNGKNLIAFLKFAYEFYKNESGEGRVGMKTEDDMKDSEFEGAGLCPMEFLEGYAGLNSSSAVEFDENFDIVFKACANKWQYQGKNELNDSDKIFERLSDIYMSLVYLYPTLKVLHGTMDTKEFNNLEDSDRAVILALAYDLKGQSLISSVSVDTDALVKKISNIGKGDLIGALIKDELELEVGERICTYMIEVKFKNNMNELARWLSIYEELYGAYTPLDADSYDSFIKSYQEAYRLYGKDMSKDTAIDYGYVENPEEFESKISLEEALKDLAKCMEKFFSGSKFYKNKDNANYAAKSYMMAKKMCENSSFCDITDIYATDVALVEHSYGYDSCQVMLADSQVVELSFPPDPFDDYDTDSDGVLDTAELGMLEQVDMTELLKEYIKYNELSEEEGSKLLANPYISMYNYNSNPVLPDSDFDGRNDKRDNHALNNSYEFHMDTDTNPSNKNLKPYDYVADYRYFFMDSTKYYAELIDMAVILSNLISKKDWIEKSWYNDTESYGDVGIKSYMWYLGNEDIEVHDMSSEYDDCNVCRYAIGSHDTIYRVGKRSNNMRNVITIAIGDILDTSTYLASNLYGLLSDNGDYSEYHHLGYDITASRIYEEVLKYIDRYEGKKVFFITGAKNGGSVANLLAKKLTDDFGYDNVYSYTFNSVGTINGNMIPDGKKIGNLKYKSIFNIYNDDELGVSFAGKETNMYLYGTNLHMSLSDNLTSKARSAYNKVHGSLYNKDIKQEVMDYINRNFGKSANDDALYAFAMTHEEAIKYLTKDIHSARSDEEKVKLLESWIWFFEAMSIEGARTEDLANIRYQITNLQADIGLNNIKCLNDYSAFVKTLSSGNLIKEAPMAFEDSNTKVDNLKILDELRNFYVENIYTYRVNNVNNDTFTEIERAKDSCLTNRKNHLINYMEKHLELKWGKHTKDNKAYDMIIDTSDKHVEDSERWTKKYHNNELNEKGFYDYNGVLCGDDCSNFAYVYMYKCLGQPKGFDTIFVNSESLLNDKLKEKISSKFEVYTDNEISGLTLKKGDILVMDGHVTIYLSDNEQFGWGHVQNNIKQGANFIKNTNKITDGSRTYTRVIRFKGE